MPVLLLPIAPGTPPPITDATRREFLALLGAAGLIAGCGSGPTAAAPATTTRSVVDDVDRTVDVPAQPQRVVILDEEIAAHVVTLGYVPLAIAWGYGPDYVTLFRGLGGTPGDLESIGSVGAAAELDLEAVAALGPDLILYPVGRDESLREQLATIAPTLVIDARANRDGRPFAQQRFLADLVGIGAVAEERIAEYQARLAEVRDRHGATLAELEYTYFDTYPGGSSYVYDVPTLAVNAVFADLGVEMTRAARELTAPDPDGYGEVSVELMAGYDADLVFLGRYDRSPIDPAVLQIMETTTAAQRGQLVQPVDANRWTFPLLQSQIEVLGEIAAVLDRGPVDASGEFR